MQIDLKPGKYVVAVSGGVDSMSLLDLLVNHKPKLNLIIAHYDHGIRKNSVKDRKLVQALATKLNLKFIYSEGRLGPNTSEEEARDKRYEFLRKVKKEYNADGIITAHHQDDLIETVIINIIRGTGRRGLSSIINSEITRPLLCYSKKDILAYAMSHHLKWNEDQSNKDPKYLRNYIRLNILPKLTKTDRNKVLAIVKSQSSINSAIDTELGSLSKNMFKENKIPRLWFSSLDNKTASEILAFWLRQNGLREYDKKILSRLVVSLKTAKENKKIDVFSGRLIEVGKDFLALRDQER